VLVYAAIQLWWPGTSEARHTVASVYYLPIYLVASVLSWRASRHDVLDGPTRRAWRLLALAGVFSWVGDCSWAFFELVRHTESTPIWVDALSLAAFPCWVAALLSFSAAPRANEERAKFWLDVATVLVGGSMLSYYIVLRPTWIASAQGDLRGLVVSLAFPSADLVVLFAVAAMLIRVPVASTRLALKLLVGSCVLGFAADLIYAHLWLSGTYHTGDPVDTLWLVQGTLFALAARVQWVVADRNAPESAADEGRAFRISLLPYASVVAGFGLLVAASRPFWNERTQLGGVLLGALTLTALVVARQVVAARDNSRLMRDRVTQALHDALTGLANRTLLLDRIAHAQVRGRRHANGPQTLLFLDLDNFKTINDSLGHGAGDALLVEAGRRLLACVRASDTVARLGGDEFAIFVEDPPDDAGCTGVAERIIAALHRPFVIGRREVFVGTSVGIASLMDGEGADDLLRNADVAMYMAKTRGKGRYERFVPEMHAVALERVELETDLRYAIDHGELLLHYQPIVILESGEITGLEALARWQHPRRGLLMPAQFIPLAERTGIIIPLGAWVLREACMRAEAWRRRRGADAPLSLTVNLSGRQLQSPQLVGDVRRALEESGMPAHALVLELTESMLTEETETVLATLQQLKAVGVRLAIDDFGTGYSSLSYLRQFPIDILKIAKPFVDDIMTEHGDGQSPSLAQAVITLGTTLAVRTIAEGIEQPEQLKRVRALGCDLGQGFHFSRPVPPSGVEALLFGADRTGRTREASTAPGARRRESGTAPL
jgi:diguanylate cyclase (GGDEF)-like protein